MNYATVSGTAVAGSDFVAAPLGASVPFAQGQTTAVVSIRILGNSVQEPWHESFRLKLTSATQPIADGTAVGIIWDDDIPW